jgi:V/A-type H+/Na+-transporting ATPase subunit G/H
MTNIVQEVLEAEKKAEQIIAQAHNDKEARLNKARNEALSYLSKQQKKIDEEQEEILQSKKESLEHQKQKVITEGESAVRGLEKKAKKNVEKATSFVLKTFQNKIKE